MTSEDNIVVRSGPIRFAQAARFGFPEIVSPADGTHATVQAVVCPQLPSRLEALMGPPLDVLAQDEDCLSLSITAPPLSVETKPVMVWFHGGGFTSGSGHLEWYEGAKLAREGDVVVVNANYRLGAFGYLVHPGLSEGNLGLRDQLAALKWVSNHIADYGGDPTNVTAIGQSAGALSIRLLMEVPDAQGLFHRAILQSPPAPEGMPTHEVALRNGRFLVDALTTDPRLASATEILKAHAATAARHQELSGVGMQPPFGPVLGVGLLESAAGTEPCGPVDVLAGWNLHEVAAFGLVGEGCRELSTAIFGGPTLEFLTDARARGSRIHAYRFDWCPAGSEFGAAHCVELPLLFGSHAAWRGSPMLGHTPWSDIEDMGQVLRQSWTQFAHAGTLDPEASAALPIRWAVGEANLQELDPDAGTRPSR